MSQRVNSSLIILKKVEFVDDSDHNNFDLKISVMMDDWSGAYILENLTP